MLKRARSAIRNRFRSRRTKLIGVAVVVALIVAIVLITRGGLDEVEQKRELPVVTVARISDIQQETTTEQVGVVEPAKRAPLVARQGGRVTAMYAHVGDTIAAHKVIVEIDGTGSDNPNRANAAGIRSSLALLNQIESVGVQAADVSVSLAQQAQESASDTKATTVANAIKAKEQADVAAEQARLGLEDARDSGNDTLIRAADIAFQQAQLAQDQSRIALQQSQEGTSQGVTSAALNLENAQLGRQQAVDQFASQRQALLNQLSVVGAQIGQQQVTSPFNGEITSLDVSVGDVLTPGQVIGEVNALEGATIRLHVSAGVADAVQVKDAIVLRDDRQSFSGSVTYRSTTPHSQTSLWQLDIGITETPDIIYPGQSVIVELPASSPSSQFMLLPLEAVVVREDSLIVFTIAGDDESATVNGHTFTPVGYEGDSVVTRFTFGDNEQIVIDGQRLLQDGDNVRIIN